MNDPSPAVPTAKPLTMTAMVERAAAIDPAATALIDGEERLTYGELLTSALTLAAGLRRAGLARGDRVGLWLPNCAFWLQMHLALSHVGAIAVGINARYPATEVAAVLRAGGVDTIVVAPGSGGLADAASVDALRQALDGQLRRVITHRESLRPHADVTLLDSDALLDGSPDQYPAAPADTPCSVFTSSGSTGEPKLILHSQGAITGHSLAVADAFAYTDPDVVVFGQLPLCGVWGFNTAYAALAAARPVVLTPRFDAERAVELVDRHRITHANGPDLFVRGLLDAAAAASSRLESLRAIGFSTFSNDSAELVELGDRFAIRLFQVYGSSEQQALMVHQPTEARPARRADPGGTPANPRTRVRVRDVDTGDLVGEQLPGQLETDGPNVMLGYLRPAALDRSAFTDDGWLRTGDLAMLTSWGFRFVGRAKDALRLSGFLVDPREIETYLEQLDTIDEAQIVGVDTERGPKAVAFVRVSADHALDEAAVLETCRRDLASFKVPVRVLAIDDFPRLDGANGPRIQRKALRDLAQPLFDTEGTPT